MADNCLSSLLNTIAFILRKLEREANPYSIYEMDTLVINYLAWILCFENLSKYFKN